MFTSENQFLPIFIKYEKKVQLLKRQLRKLPSK